MKAALLAILFLLTCLLTACSIGPCGPHIMTQEDWRIRRETKQHNEELRRFEEEARRTVDPVKFQEWTVAQLNTHSNRYLFPNEDLPAYLKLASGPIQAIILSNRTNRWVDLSWGTERRHFGIVVGDTNFVRKDTIHERLTPWKAGMYFYDETGI
jgi:hypothetical protein